MKRIISILIALSVVLPVFPMPVMAAGDSITVQAQKYAVASETPVKSGRKIIVNSGVTVIYNADITTAGLYKVALYCTGEDTVLDYSVNGETGSYDFSQYGDSETYLARTLGRYNFTPGTASISITPSQGNVTVTKLVLTRLVTDVSAESETLIEAEEYTSFSFYERAYVDNQSEYSLTYDTLSNIGCVVFTGNNQTAAYTLNAAKAGYYRITMYATGLLERNKLTLRDVYGSVLSTGEYVNENVYVFNDVPLSSGENEIVLNTGRGLYISASDYNFIYAYCFKAEKIDTTQVFVEKGGETEILPNLYAAHTGTVTEDESGTITMGAGSSVTYQVCATKADTYKLLAMGKASSGVATVTIVCGDKTESRRFESGKKKNTLGRYELGIGINTVTISVSAASVIEMLYFKPVTYDIGEDTVYIPAIDYIETSLGESAVVDNQYDYSYTMDGISGKGAATFSTTGQYLRYSVNVEKSGWYSFSMCASGVQSDMKYTLTSQTSGRSAYGAMSDTNLISFDRILLDEGKNILELKSASGNYYVDGKVKYVFCYCLKSELAWAAAEEIGTIKTTSENVILAESCTSVLGNPQKTSDGIQLGTNERMIYDFDCEAEHLFELKIHADADVKIRVNGINIFESGVDGEATVFVTLNEGENVLTADGVGVFEKFILTPVTQEYVDAFDISEAQTIEEVESKLSELGLTVQELFYTRPVFERLLQGNEKSGNALLQAFYRAVHEEKQSPKVRLYKDDTEIYALEDGDLKMTVSNMGKTAIAAIYDGEMLTDAKVADGDIIFENVSGANKSFKIIYFEDLKSITPANVFRQAFAEIFVSPEGNDEEGDGSAENPYATIKAAKEAARLISDEQWGDIVVNILPGIYRIDETECFTSQDSGKNGFNIIYKGTDPDNPPLISGGRKINGWEQTDGVIWSAPLEDMEYVRNLYINGYPAARARSKYQYEMEDYYKTDSASDTYDGFYASAINFPKSFAAPEDMELVFNVAWYSDRIPVEDISYSGNNAMFKVKSDIIKALSGRFTDRTKWSPFYIENAKELLDEPGEFYYSKDEGRIYYYPHSIEDMTRAEAFVGETELLVNISGESIENKVKNISFENLTFRYGAYNFASRYGYVSSQSDGLDGSVMDDGSTIFAPQFDVKLADNIKIKDCEFSCLGSAVIGMQEGVTNCEITGNLIRDVSGTAIAIGRPLHHDYSAEQQVCENIKVSNNVIRRSGNEFFNNAAISVYYERNIDISNNTLLDLPYTGVTAGWGWEGSDPYDCGNISISNNHIENVLQILYDGGQIYTLGKLKNSEISGNFLKKNNVQYWSGGIYLDAGSSYMQVYNNVVEESLPWVEVQHRNYNTHDIKIFNNYSDTTIRDHDEASTVLIETPGSSSSAEAAAIKANAGVTDEYKHLIARSELPAGKRSRADFVPRFYFKYDKPQSKGKVQAEDFIEGGEGVGYSRLYQPRPNNNAYRSEGVWLIRRSGSENLVSFYNSAGDWYNYDVNLESSGWYYIDVCGTASGTTKVARMYANDNLVGDINIPGTGFATGTTGPVWLDAGVNRIKLYQLQSFEIDYLEVHKEGESDTTDYSPKEDPSYDEGVLVYE